MSAPGWNALLDGAPGLREKTPIPSAAYSEFMPPPRLGLKPYRTRARVRCRSRTTIPMAGKLTSTRRRLELRPGLEQVGRQLVQALARLAQANPATASPPRSCSTTPIGRCRLAEKAGTLTHERFVVLAPLALSRTQDDKGRVRWTLFGGSEQGPERAFWKSFLYRSRQGSARRDGNRFHSPSAGRRATAWRSHGADDLHAAGFRILPHDKHDARLAGGGRSAVVDRIRYL